MRAQVDVIIEDNIRKPDYEGNYTLIEDKGNTMIIEDKGNTMIIEVEGNLEEKVAEHDTKIVTLEETIDVLYGGV